VQAMAKTEKKLLAALPLVSVSSFKTDLCAERAKTREEEGVY
jgi:hypothetical protein